MDERQSVDHAEARPKVIRLCGRTPWPPARAPRPVLSTSAGRRRSADELHQGEHEFHEIMPTTRTVLSKKSSRKTTKWRGRIALHNDFQPHWRAEVRLGGAAGEYIAVGAAAAQEAAAERPEPGLTLAAGAGLNMRAGRPAGRSRKQKLGTSQGTP